MPPCTHQRCRLAHAARLVLAPPSCPIRQGFHTEIEPLPVAVRSHTMKLKILLCSLLFAAIAAKNVYVEGATTDIFIHSGRGLQEWSNFSTYTLSTDKLSWDDAEAMCKAKGQQLATVHSAAQNELLSTAAGPDYVWIGGTYDAPEGTSQASRWMWSQSNTPLSYTNWSPGKPDSPDTQHCLAVYGNGKWDDGTCTSHQKYVCQASDHVFTSKAELQTAVQAFDANSTVAIATYGPIADWDVSKVFDMSHLFDNLKDFNENISNWITSGVTTMERMFYVRFTRV